MISLLLITSSFLPNTAKASVIKDFLASLVKDTSKQQEAVAGAGNVQTIPLLKPAMNIDPSLGHGGGDITIVDSSALMPEEGPSGTIADIEKPKVGAISIYVVRQGDTLASIAKLFGVSSNTILWANDIPKSSSLTVGQVLTILPVTGVQYKVKKGDTLGSIAKRYGADAGEISAFNGLEGPLSVGDEIIIPDGEEGSASLATNSSKPRVTARPHNVGPEGTPDQIGYYLRPIVGGVESQRLHGYNAIDLAAPRGTPILASAEGDVLIARTGGWNAGYGNYVVIQHGNGSQTLYGHATKVIVYSGEHVVQGQVIGYVGATGNATGPHVHFEIRNGIRNPF